MQITLNETLNQISDTTLRDKVNAIFTAASLLQYNVKSYLTDLWHVEVARVIIENSEKEFSILIHSNNHITIYKHHNGSKSLTMEELMKSI